MTTQTIAWLAFGMFTIAAVQNAPPAPALLSSARTAIGGSAKLGALRSLVLEGQTRNLIGSTGQLSEPRPLEIRILRPDRYLRIQVHEFYELRAGFAGGELLNSARALRADSQFGATYGPEQLDIERATFVRLMLGMLADTTAVMPLTVRAGSAGSVQLLGPNGFSAFLDFDERTHVPMRLRFRGMVHFPRPGTTMPPPSEEAEVTWSFEDRREVSGLTLPHRIVRTARDVTLEETRFDRIRVNVPLTAKDFQKAAAGG